MSLTWNGGPLVAPATDANSSWNGGPLVAPDEPDEPAPPTLEERVRALETRLALVEAALEEPEEDATAEATADLVQRTLAVLAGRR